MGKQFDSLNDTHRDFIEKQKIFFVATATADSTINLSPKGMDTFKVVDKNKVLWLNLTGSGNETAAHLSMDQRITIMFCAFEGAPMILRLYGKGKVYHKNAAEWDQLLDQFSETAGARQIIEVQIEKVQKSCGMSIPLYDYKEDRLLLKEWAQNKGEEGLKQYWEDKNGVSIDTIPTHINQNLK